MHTCAMKSGLTTFCWAALAVIFLSGCSSSRLVGSGPESLPFSELNSRLECQPCILTFHDGRRIAVSTVHLAPDSTRFVRSGASASETVVTPSIKFITVDPDTNIGALVGVGTMFGGVVAMFAAEQITGGRFSGTLLVFYGGAVAAVAGVTTFVVSLLSQDAERYRIAESE